MTLTELTKDVQFMVDQGGQVTAIVVDPALWSRILAALEDAEDRALIQTLGDRLANGPVAGKALRWQDVADQWLGATIFSSSQRYMRYGVTCRAMSGSGYVAQ